MIITKGTLYLVWDSLLSVHSSGLGASLARRPSPPRYAAARRSRAGGEGLAKLAAYYVSREFPFSYTVATHVYTNLRV